MKLNHQAKRPNQKSKTNLEIIPKIMSAINLKRG